MSNQIVALDIVPKPPAGMSVTAIDTWLITAEYLVIKRLLHAADLPMLEDFCEATAALRGMRAAVAQDGYMIKEKSHPLLSRISQTAQGLRSVGVSLGLTAQGRQRLSASVRDSGPTTQEIETGAGWEGVLD